MTRTKELLEEFGREAAGTRRLLELVPQKHLAWKPHEKSMSIGRLAVTMTECDELDLAAGPFYQPFEPASLRGLLVEFGSRVSDFNGALLAARDADLDVTWTLRRGDRVIAALTRGLALRQLVLNHLVHHRGQLSVYLRLLEVSLPQVYGPTADHAEFTVVESESRRTSGRMLFEELAYAL
jgi:uncharacterized damage-inducible protein DinB